MGQLERADAKFNELAFDPTKRREHIKKLESRRRIGFVLLWVMVAIYMVEVGVRIVFDRAGDSSGGSLVMLVFALMMFNTLESSLRLMQVVDRLSPRTPDEAP